MNQIKNSFLKKKTDSPVSRNTLLQKPGQLKTVLLISNTESKSLKRKVEGLFSSASVYHLFPREIKDDRTVGFYYTVHNSDFNLTGILKNDKLKNLENSKVDLLIDLSFGSELLNYFVNKVKAELKVGDINSPKSSLYDLMIEFQSNENQNIESIFNQLKNFTQYASEQV